MSIKHFRDLEKIVRESKVITPALIQDIVSFLHYFQNPESFPLNFLKEITSVAKQGLKRQAQYDIDTLKTLRKYCNEGNKQIRMERRACDRKGKQLPELLRHWNSHFYSTASEFCIQMSHQDKGATYLLSGYKNSTRAMQSAKENPPSEVNTKFLAFTHNQRAEVETLITRHAGDRTPFWLEKAVDDQTESAEMWEKISLRQAIFEYAGIVKKEWLLTKYFSMRRDFEPKKEHASKAILTGEKCFELLELTEDKEIINPVRYIYFNLALSYRALFECTREDNYREKACRNFEKFLAASQPKEDGIIENARDNLAYLQRIKASSKLQACPSPK